jgi:endonuclease G
MRTSGTVSLAVIASVLAYFAVGHLPKQDGRHRPGREVQAPVGDAYPSTDGDAQSCAGTHPSGSAPTIPSKLMASTVVRCRISFEILHSGLTRTPLWVSERLTRETVTAARDLERVDRYRPDSSLPRNQRAELSDYRRSGWDRGHMAPNDDMPNDRSQQEAFELSNISPQAPDLNRGPWKELESDVRRYAARAGVAYVVTGVLFEGGELDTLPGGRVAIPTSFWKAVHVPKDGSVVMVAANERGARPMPMSIDAFVRRTGIDPFPSISRSDRETPLEIEGRDAR